MGAILLQTPLRICLVLAGLYQLGGCPCGCLDHNAWSDVALALCSDASGHDDAPNGGAPPCDEDHPAPDSVILAESAGHQKTRTDLAWDAAHSSELLVPTQFVHFSHGSRQDLDRLPCRPASLADCQVLRL
ncbi:hypothetical protein Pla123a_30440 [Posidoniimonas polymericola]|uniref:Uncharacterized protein n=1 Tax=Posidoniimonas polymericola TaxID=2528002 RepID=A0A5C5YL06_9BACT|nr:hypothetical protein [Posidoniimonas polymericola]TWT75534.1 hypothetical protein Pla123a_30440 [Posidoniimonas polymericola]